MNKIKIRKDLHNQYINNTSALTFKQLENNYNTLIDLINATNEKTQAYVICLITKNTFQYVEYCINGKIYDDLQKAVQDCKDLNFKNTNLKLEYNIEFVEDISVTKLAQIVYNMLNN